MSRRRRNRSRRSSHTTDDGDCRTLHVGVMKSKLPNYITSTHLQQHFSDFEGDIEKAIIIRDHKTKESQGYGLVTFTSQEAAENAMYALKGTKLCDKFPLFMRLDKKSQPLKSDSTPRGSCELFFKAMKSRLPDFIHKKHIRNHFAEFDTDIVSVIIARDNDTKQSKGFGFIKFTSHQVAMEAKKKLHGSMLQGEFQLHVDIRKSSKSSAPGTASVCVTSDDSEMPYTATFQLKHDVTNIKERLASSFDKIGSINNTPIQFVKRGGRHCQIVTIRGCTVEDVDQSRKEVEDYVERNHDCITKSIEVSYGCAKYLQVKHVSFLNELEGQCEINIPSDPVIGESVSITIQGKKVNVEDVIKKLKLLLSECHVETFEKSYPKNYAKLWNMLCDRFSSEVASLRQLSILIDFTTVTAQMASVEDRKNTVTVTIVGNDKAVVQGLKDRVLKDDSCSNVTVQQMKLSEKEFKALSCNLDELELKLEEQYSTVIVLQEHESVVELQVPSSLKNNLESAQKEVTKCIGCVSPKQPLANTSVTQHQSEMRYNDIVVGMLITTKPQYCEEIQRTALRRSVTVHIQKVPKPSIQLQGSCEDVEATEQEISSLTKDAKRSISQTQLEVGMATYRLLSMESFLACEKELLNRMFVRVTYPPHQLDGLLRQQLLHTSARHIITLQLCAGELTTENVDAIIVDLDQAENLPDPIFSQKFKKYIQKNGPPTLGSATCHESGSLLCRNVIVVPVPNWKSGTHESAKSLLFSPFEESFICADSKGFGVISFFLSGNSEKASNDISTVLVLIEQFCKSHPTMSMHTIRILINSVTSAACTSTFDKQVPRMELTKSHCDSGPPVESSTKDSSSCSPASNQELVWQWRDDAEKFVSYPPHISSRLSKKSRSDPNGKCFFKANGKAYIVDFSVMKQKNMSTDFTRDVRCLNNISTDTVTNQLSDRSGVCIQWYYMDDQNVLTPYTKADSELIEKMYNHGMSTKETTDIVINRRRYYFDFSAMKQINSATRHSRSIQRREMKAATKEKAKKKNPSQENENQKLVITLRGPTENLENAKRMVETKLKELHYTKTVPLPQAASNHLQQKLHTITRKHTVDYRIKDDSTIEVTGPEHAVQEAVTEILTEIIHFQSEPPPGASSPVDYPQEWEHQTRTTEVFKLSIYSDERRKIAIQLKETLPNARIINIERIQNKWLWERYEQSRKRMAEKNSGRVNEMQLFHGSRNTSAEKIYDSEEGFDVRFSSQGLWGMANYFAVDASYSDLYAYSRPDGCKELLLAKVLTGDSYTSQSDQSLRMPPEKIHNDSNIQLKQLRYDTVNGVTNNTQVFMTYANDKAYPAYLIVYSIPSHTAPVRSVPATHGPPLQTIPQPRPARVPLRPAPVQATAGTSAPHVRVRSPPHSMSKPTDSKSSQSSCCIS